MRVSSRIDSSGRLRLLSRGRYAMAYGLPSQRRGAPPSVARSRAPTRHERYLKLRSRRRRQGLLWALLAAVVLLCAWDVAARIDQLAYNPPSLSE